MAQPEFHEDELVLLVDYHLDQQAGRGRRLADLCWTLQSLAIHSDRGDAEVFRNEDGVGRALRRIRAAADGQLRPTERPLMQAVVRRWKDDPLLKSEVAAIVAQWTPGGPAPDRRSQDPLQPTFPSFDGAEGYEAAEGALVTRLHRARERDPALSRKKKEQASRRGTMRCEACGWDPIAAYGDRGASCLECHHKVPLSALAAQTSRRLDDLALICANCHRLVHGAAPWLRWEQLLALVRPAS